MRNVIAPLLVAATLGAALAPVQADAQPRHRHKVWVCKDPRRAGNTGTVVGALGGALVGSAIAGHGDKTAGALIGAGVGGVTGHQIAKQNAKHNCHWEWRYR